MCGKVKSATAITSPKRRPKSQPRQERENEYSESTSEDAQLLSQDPDSWNESNVPPGFEPAPPSPVFRQGGSREEYKAFMLAKYNYEAWQNKLLLHKKKVRAQIDQIKARSRGGT